MEQDLKWLFEVHEGLPRQGPGDFSSTKKAFFLMKDLPPKPAILDIGCGPGKQTLDLAKITEGKIIAIDNHQPFVDILNKNAGQLNLSHRAHGQVGDMNNLSFDHEFFDIIWSEGAIYNIGFENGLNRWKPFLKSGGFIAVTEACWLKTNSPEKLQKFWEVCYPAMQDINGNLKIIKRTGYKIIDHFVLPEFSWWNDYYTPLEKNIVQFRGRHKNNQEALAYVDSEQQEIDFYRKYSDYYGYVFYVMRKDV
jgi:ubiquinone/menaquinone biosynthesis C-methylase UbiE